MGQAGDERAREEVLADGEEDGAAELLGEEDERDAEGHVGARQRVLGREVGGSEAAADAQAEEDLVADPLGVGGGWGEGREEAGAGGAEDGADEHGGDVVADLLRDDGGEDAHDGQRQEGWHCAEAGVHC